jgi:dihydropteroate synthase
MEVTMKSGQENLADVVQWKGGRLDFSGGCIVMGVLNVTPDSFSDGGEFLDADKAVEHGVRMASEGAVIIDVGGESTRPGSERVTASEQIRRVVPVIKGLSEKVDVAISIDTYDVEVVKAALEAGASMINDITALGDARMGELAAERADG